MKIERPGMCDFGAQWTLEEDSSLNLIWVMMQSYQDQSCLSAGGEMFLLTLFSRKYLEKSIYFMAAGVSLSRLVNLHPVLAVMCCFKTCKAFQCFVMG